MEMMEFYILLQFGRIAWIVGLLEQSKQSSNPGHSLFLHSGVSCFLGVVSSDPCGGCGVAG